jgi:hypothetical protein
MAVDEEELVVEVVVMAGLSVLPVRPAVPPDRPPDTLGTLPAAGLAELLGDGVHCGWCPAAAALAVPEAAAPLSPDPGLPAA